MISLIEPFSSNRGEPPGGGRGGRWRVRKRGAGDSANDASKGAEGTADAAGAEEAADVDSANLDNPANSTTAPTTNANSTSAARSIGEPPVPLSAAADSLADSLADHADSAPAAAPAAPQLTPPVFAQNGWLHQALQLQHRPQQAHLADAIARAFAADSPLLCEAGTGVGKSLAYLVPGLIHAVDSGRQLVVSTHTIPLQEQIQNNDLAKCRALFESVPALRPYAAFKTALLVGKGNYLCGTRLAKALQNHSELLETTQQSDLRLIQEWAARTRDGLREELPAPVSHEVWDWVNADSSLCNRRNCSPQTCPYQRARERIAEASLVIVNHALLLSLIAAGAAPHGDARGVLYAGDFAVLDEAHRLPDVATDHFGASVTAHAIERQLKMLWNPRRNKGLLSPYNKDADRNLIAEIFNASEIFFNSVHAAFLERASIWRQRRPNWADPVLHDPLARLCIRLKELTKIETNRDRADELADILRRLARLNSALDDALTLGQAPEYVYWVERGGVKGRNISVNSAPLDVSALIREHIFERKTSVILTSATLTDTPNSMRRFQGQTGSLAVPTHIEASPFDYPRNMQIYVAADAPDVTRARERGGGNARSDNAAAPNAVAAPAALTPELAWQTAIIAHCVRAIPHGGTLVLCTSHGDVRKLHAALTAEFATDNATAAAPAAQSGTGGSPVFPPPAPPPQSTAARSPMECGALAPLSETSDAHPIQSGGKPPHSKTSAAAAEAASANSTSAAPHTGETPVPLSAAAATPSAPRRVLAQLPGASRAALVREFRESGNAILIGTDSFWTGVDVPGPALSQVILLRLPFENPSHPIVEARTEWLESQGRSPFGEMSLPAALIKFRQGIGRLIRTVEDRGRLVILDSRVLTKTYGRHFVSALPHARFTRFTRATLATAIPPYH